MSWAIVVAAVSGCGGEPRANVTGTITLKGGAPAAGALILARSEATGKSASGQADGDGRYTLGVDKMGDGIPPGDYAVAIMGERMGFDGPAKATFAARYGDYDTSGLTLSVADGESKVVDFQLDAE